MTKSTFEQSSSLEKKEPLLDETTAKSFYELLDISDDATTEDSYRQLSPQAQVSLSSVVNEESQLDHAPHLHATLQSGVILEEQRLDGVRQRAEEAQRGGRVEEEEGFVLPPPGFEEAVEWQAFATSTAPSAPLGTSLLPTPDFKRSFLSFFPLRTDPNSTPKPYSPALAPAFTVANASSYAQLDQSIEEEMDEDDKFQFTEGTFHMTFDDDS